MRAAAGEGIVVLTRSGRLRPDGSIDGHPVVSLDGLLVAGWDDPLESPDGAPGRRQLELAEGGFVRRARRAPRLVRRAPGAARRGSRAPARPRPRAARPSGGVGRRPGARRHGPRPPRACRPGRRPRARGRRVDRRGRSVRRRRGGLRARPGAPRRPRARAGGRPDRGGAGDRGGPRAPDRGWTDRRPRSRRPPSVPRVRAPRLVTLCRWRC